AADPAQRDPHSAVRLLEDPEHGIRREDAEVVRLLRLQSALDAQRRPGLVFRVIDERRGARLQHQFTRPARSEQLLEAAERNDDELVERVAERRALLRADAD